MNAERMLKRMTDVAEVIKTTEAVKGKLFATRVTVMVRFLVTAARQGMPLGEACEDLRLLADSWQLDHKSSEAQEILKTSQALAIMIVGA